MFNSLGLRRLGLRLEMPLPPPPIALETGPEFDRLGLEDSTKDVFDNIGCVEGVLVAASGAGMGYLGEDLEQEACGRDGVKTSSSNDSKLVKMDGI